MFVSEATTYASESARQLSDAIEAVLLEPVFLVSLKSRFTNLKTHDPLKSSDSLIKGLFFRAHLVAR